MYARVTTGQIPLDQIGEGVHGVPDDVRQSLAREPGFKGTFFLLDRQSGKVMTIGLWESEAAVQASMAGHQERMARSSATGTSLAVEVYEVVDEIRPQG